MLYTWNLSPVPAIAVDASPEEEAILRALAYFDIFQYPLLADEIRQFSDRLMSPRQLLLLLADMTARERIFCHHGFYMLHNNPLLVHRRRQENNRAARMLPAAVRIGRFLGKFPFVRSVAISGSLSKNVADTNADIDFFIITRANRLWIARTCMHLFKKLTFLTGHQHYFCMNYYIDEEALHIAPHNVYTATEIQTLIPVAGADCFNRLLTSNVWTAAYFPNTVTYDNAPTGIRVSWLKKWIEAVISIFPLSFMDRWLERLTARRWRRKAARGDRNHKGHSMQLITGRHFSRSNPGEFQERVLARYEEKLEQLGIGK